ncbi:MAG: ATP-binding protein [Flavobacteriaceae bacterium]|nr:ATP-binding protein [Flavobacteriaceae bacterium]
MQKKILITGAPGTGKTSIIQALESLGYLCHHEIIRDLTADAQKELSPENIVSNPIVFVNDPQDFNNKLLKGRIEQFINSDFHEEPLAFFDRGIPDVLAYMDYFRQQYRDDFIEACKRHVYDNVFLLPPWESIYVVDNERFESYEQALDLHIHIENTYKNLGYQLIEVPHASVENRIRFILDQLKMQ